MPLPKWKRTPVSPVPTRTEPQRRALLYGAPKVPVAPVYGAGKATDFVNRSKKVYP